MNLNDLESGVIVVVEAPDFFRGRKLATTMNRCKWHDNAIECLLLDEKVSVRKICVSFNKPDDHIILLSDLNQTS